ncbi:MAG: ribosome-associated translation inhibitor RaiA [Opitutae bacterium]|nr:ribosome-associated translation inhibitor RaiA [Opitutae bacterium]
MNDKIIVSGIHVSLTPALKQAIEQKTEKLLRHNSHIIRLRVDLEHDQTKGPNDRFVAKGHIEIDGPDLIATAASDDGYKSIDLLVDKLDQLLRRRHEKRVDKRDDERRQAPGVLHGKQ